MAKYSRKPVVVDALQWDGTNNDAMSAFLVEETTGLDVRWTFSHESEHTDAGPTHHMELVIGVQTLDGVQVSGDLPIAAGDWVVCNENEVLVRLTDVEFTTAYEPAPDVPAGPATGATEVVGAAGQWTPAGSTPPADYNAMFPGPITASPSTQWQAGSHMKCGNNESVYWDGSFWQQDVAPPYPDVGGTAWEQAGQAGVYTPSFCTPPKDLAHMISLNLVANPTTKWSTGSFMPLQGGAKAHWDGTAWTDGVG